MLLLMFAPGKDLSPIVVLLLLAGVVACSSAAFSGVLVRTLGAPSGRLTVSLLVVGYHTRPLPRACNT